MTDPDRIRDEVEDAEFHAYLADENALPVTKAVVVIFAACLLALVALAVGVMV